MSDQISTPSSIEKLNEYDYRDWRTCIKSYLKAYDRLKWSLVHYTLQKLGIPNNLIRAIMVCISSSSFRVLWNGEKTREFYPNHGLRQRDPLSPYLFVLCMERLGHMVNMLVDNGCWKPITLARNGPKLTHLCFADDIILFARADVEQARTVKNCLETFCQDAGLRVSLQKSSLIKSRNVPTTFAQTLSSILGISLTKKMGKYLGVPSLQKRVTGRTYNEVLERMQQKLQGWKSRCLSMAGRVTLIKAVTSVVPSHIMQTTALPKDICDKMDRCQRQFLWGSTERNGEFIKLTGKGCANQKIRAV